MRFTLFRKPFPTLAGPEHCRLFGYSVMPALTLGLLRRFPMIQRHRHFCTLMDAYRPYLVPLQEG